MQVLLLALPARTCIPCRKYANANVIEALMANWTVGSDVFLITPTYFQHYFLGVQAQVIAEVPDTSQQCTDVERGGMFYL